MTATIIEKCKHILTKDEVREKADALARKMGEIDLLREQRKEIAARIKGDVDRLVLETKTLASAVLSGSEYRDTECAIEMNYDMSEVKVRRLDTKEVIRVRTMTPAEKQTELTLSRDLPQKKSKKE